MFLFRDDIAGDFDLVWQPVNDSFNDGTQNWTINVYIALTTFVDVECTDFDTSVSLPATTACTVVGSTISIILGISGTATLSQP